ncbi:MAG: helix-turn-helix domain-containing protein [Oscillospiraceae bacterium]|nr:helix-turn-helix domain-containing protein [Oscillospiraceae bacterium]
MNEIIISTTGQPVICGCDFLAVSEPFFHADRVLDFNVLIYVVDGAVYVSEGETDYEVNEGELLFLKKGIRHYGKREISRGTKWYYAHFFLDERSGECREFQPDTASIGVDEPLTLFDVLPKKVSGLKNGHIEKKFSEIAEYCHSEDSFKRMKINGMFHSLLIDIALLKYTEKKPDTLSERICVWLNEHCTEPFSASRLEHEFFLSYKRMAAVFRQEQGKTMQQYHTNRRMSRACYLLRSTLLPVSEVAASVGYDDPLYFSRCFHAFSGVSPSSYRLSAKSDY